MDGRDMTKTMHLFLKALSDPDTKLNVQKSRRIMNLKVLDPFKPFYRTLDTKIYRGNREIPIRIYFPNEESYDTVDIEEFQEKNAKLDTGSMRDNSYPVILYIHGGGFVTESVESYNRVCWNLAKHTRRVVVSIDYPLAPEYRFPTQIEDCYAVAKAVFTDRSILNTVPEAITIMGDSAGGNIAAAVSLMARDRGEFLPLRQILIYPCVNNNYEENNGFPSVMENGEDYLLTRQNMKDYLEYYESSPEDRENPYFAPLLAENLEGLPKTLVITAELDPLRDEGEEFARRLSQAGNEVEHHRIEQAIHGFFLLEPLYSGVREVYDYVNDFLGREIESC
ncbi:alpha/beta hydrolase [Blautia sp.]|uniref:alpha/beta hydrolase n=2 Tax=Blautia sp. TaxID=1955243 RepID=UPI00262A1118|nr:alpha/beta hydrolase [Blautia sp.]